jgi:hypothetical protein
MKHQILTLTLFHILGGACECLTVIDASKNQTTSCDPIDDDGRIGNVFSFRNPNVKTGRTLLRRASIQDITYNGAFRLKNGQFGISSVDYAVGTLAYNPGRHSLFVVGHAQQNAIAEFPIVSAGKQTNVQDLPETPKPLQNFIDLLAKVDNPEGLDRITGMIVIDGILYVNVESWYDGGGDNKDTSLYVSDANKLSSSTTAGLFRLQGAANCAGYMGRIPPEFQARFGGAEYYTGWSSVYSILSRYSLGPSFWTFRPDDMKKKTTTESRQTVVTTIPWVNYGYSNGNRSHWLSPRATEWAAQGSSGPFVPSDKLWNPLSQGMYGFFIPSTRTWCVIGTTAGLVSGIGYKAVQSNG